LRKLETELVEAAPAQVTEDMVRAIIAETLGGAPAFGDLAQVVADLRSKFEQLPQAAQFELPDEQWVENHAGGIVHIIKDASTSMCGWAYPSSRAAILREAPDSTSRLCSSCVKFRGLLL
jgi:hypothetical protein